MMMTMIMMTIIIIMGLLERPSDASVFYYAGWNFYLFSPASRSYPLPLLACEFTVSRCFDLLCFEDYWSVRL